MTKPTVVVRRDVLSPDEIRAVRPAITAHVRELERSGLLGRTDSADRKAKIQELLVELEKMSDDELAGFVDGVLARPHETAPRTEPRAEPPEGEVGRSDSLAHFHTPPSKRPGVRRTDHATAETPLEASVRRVVDAQRRADRGAVRPSVRDFHTPPSKRGSR